LGQCFDFLLKTFAAPRALLLGVLSKAGSGSLGEGNGGEEVFRRLQTTASQFFREALFLTCNECELHITNCIYGQIMKFDTNVIFTDLASPVAVLFVKALLDFSLVHWFVKYFWWVPVRSILRDRYPNLSGKWEQVWGAGGVAFQGLLSLRHLARMSDFCRPCAA
jgi:hypothetical protein